MSIFKGTTVDCLKHLGSKLPKDRQDQIASIASFTDSSQRSVSGWLKEAPPPSGASLIRLRFYLALIGYEVSELASLSDSIRRVAKLFAFGVLSLSDISAHVGYVSGKNSEESLLTIFRGKRGVSKKKEETFKELFDAYSDQLSTREQAVEKIVLESVGAEGVEKTPLLPVALKVTAPRRLILGIRETLIESLALQVKGMIPSARLIGSDEFTEEERAKVRALAGSDGVFILANALYRMCGERSRAQHPEIGVAEDE